MRTTRILAAGDAAAIETAQAIRVLVHGDEALLKQLTPDFEDRLIAFDPKLVKQVPDVELTPGNFSQTPIGDITMTVYYKKQP